MRILMCGNCTVDGLEVFLKRALPHHEYRRLPHLATFYGEFSEEKIADDHAWADLVFYHHKHDDPQDYPTKQPKVPLSVWYQSAPFIAQAKDSDWGEVDNVYAEQGLQRACEFAVREAYMNEERRWEECYEKMKFKEVNEHVPEDIRVSPLMDNMGRFVQLQLTCNHPTSYVFAGWTYRLCAFLGEKPGPDAVSIQEAVHCPNIANLPCEESATTAARKHLGLGWGGRPEDDDSGRLITRQHFGHDI